MLRYVRFEKDDGNVVKLFISDDSTGHSGSDMLSVPGVYDTVISNNAGADIHLEVLAGGINGYKTKMYGMVMDATNCEDITDYVSKALIVPESGVFAVLRMYTEDVRQMVQDTLEVIHRYESVRETDKLCLPAQALSSLPSDVVSRITSVRRSYVLKSTENQEVFQKSAEDEYCISLPPLESVHAALGEISLTEDVLRVCLPCRKQDGPSRFRYRSIYHTPYYKVDPKLNGMIPSDMEWLNGYSVNDTQEIYSSERHMYNNLMMYYCSDVSRYIVEMVSGVFLGSKLGSIIGRFCNNRDLELMTYLCDEMQSNSDENASCIIPIGEADNLYQNGWPLSSVAELVKSNLKIKDGYLKELILSRGTDRRVVDCDNLPFTLNLTDDQEHEFTEIMIEMGYISGSMRTFLVNLCQTAYTINWGHTGAARAIPSMVDRSNLMQIDKEIASFLLERSRDVAIDRDRYPSLYEKEVASEDEDTDDDESTTKIDEPGSRIAYYLSTDTVRRIENEMLSYDYFNSEASVAQTTEASIVEYWRTVNGTQNLDMFLSSAYFLTGKVSIFFEAFIKLMRWGSRKPRVLVFQEYDAIRHVFDLNTGMKTDNFIVVNEDDLVKVNGCDYSLKAVLQSNSNKSLQDGKIIGFLLQKDYGSTQKLFLASWVDLGEIAKSGKNILGEFKSISEFSLQSANTVYVEDFGKINHELYISDSNIAEGLKQKIQPKDLSAMSLFTTNGVLDSVGYLRSLKNDRIITVKDRQYEILRRYSETLNKFYSTRSDAISSIHTTMDLSELAGIFLDMYNSGECKSDSNDVTAKNNLSMLNFGNQSSQAESVWTSAEVSGKFYSIVDMEMLSTLPPIEFSDTKMKTVAGKVRNRIVLLLIEQDGKFIFCRKDIVTSELKLIKKADATGAESWKIALKSYKAVAPVVEGLLAGRPLKINGMPAMLHESVRSYL